METLDSTIISTSLPVIATDLRQDPIALKLALTSYLLSLAIFIPVSGWMADRYGARVIFRAAIGIFTLGSILCGLSGSLGGFVAAHIVQEAGVVQCQPTLAARTKPADDPACMEEHANLTETSGSSLEDQATAPVQAKAPR